MTFAFTDGDMQAGKLRNIVTIQAATKAKNDFGEMVNTWADYATVNASIETLKGYERASAAATWAASDVKITIRYLAGVLPSMRVKCGDTIFSILGVNDVENRHREIQLTCETGVKNS